jgi:YidC/Oxa1 family membrane protein insertase
LDTTRVLIAVVLSLVLVFAYQEIVLKRLYPPPDTETQKPAPPPPVAATPLAVAPDLPSVTAAPERNIEVETDLYVATFTTRGARLKSFRLKHYTKGVSPESGLYEMVETDRKGELPLGLVMGVDDAVADDAALVYASEAPDGTRLGATGSARVVFTAQTEAGAQLQKAFTFTGGSYVFTVDASVAGAAPTALGLSLEEHLRTRADSYDVVEFQAEVEGKTTNESLAGLEEQLAPLTGKVTYAGFGDRYFLSAFLPETAAAGTVRAIVKGDEASMQLVFEGATEIRSLVYMGPKRLEVLEEVNPALSSAIDFGWTGILALPMLRTLKLFQYLSPNWGVDIIVLTIVLRIVILPMSIKSQRSMMRMQRLQPQMQRLREKLKGEPEKLNREMMDLYKRNHVNPLGGCLPMLIQLPIFVGLYQALLNSIELRHAPFVLWMNDMSAPDCLHVSWMPMIPYTACAGIPVLVILMGLSTFVQQWMSPASPDPQQQRMMMLMPIVFTVLLINFPAGLSLYYFSSNVLGIIQQLFLNREFRQQTPVTA